MTYRLIQLAPGSYDLLLDGRIIASVVRGGTHPSYTIWTAELLEDLPPRQRPAPFIKMEHSFSTFEEVCSWLGGPEVKSNRRNAAMTHGSLR